MKHRFLIVVLVCAALACPAYLGAAASDGDEYATTALNYTLYESGRFSVTLDALHFSPTLGVALSCTANNGYANTSRGVTLSECVLDGLCLQLDMSAPVVAAPGESVAFLVPSTMDADRTLYLMGVEDAHGISVRYRVLDEQNRTLERALSPEYAVPRTGTGSSAATDASDGRADAQAGVSSAADALSQAGTGATAAAYLPDVEPLYDGYGLRVYNLGFDAAIGQATLLFDRTGGDWHAMRVSAVFDGVREGRCIELLLAVGQRGVYTFSASQAASGVDIYLTPDCVNTLRKPVRLTLESPAPAKERADEEAPLWTAGDCELRFAGISRDYFTDSDALLFECVNRSDSTTYWLYPAYGYVYLDGIITQVRTTGAECHPRSRCMVAIAAEDLSATDLSAYQTLEPTLGLYKLEAGKYLKQAYVSSGLKIALK